MKTLSRIRPGTMKLPKLIPSRTAMRRPMAAPTTTN
jgi:hypothetical protein